MNIAELQEELIKRNINMTAREIAEVWGMDETSFSKKKRIGSEIKHKNIEQLENKLNISFTADIFIENEPAASLDYYPDIEVSCGTGIIPFGETKEKISIPLRLIKGYAKNHKYVVLNAISDSMKPEIKPNDKLIVRLIDAEPIMDNHIYIFCHEDRLYCKYLSYNIGQIIVRSANTDYPTRYIEGENLDTFRLCGEVCGCVRMF